MTRQVIDSNSYLITPSLLNAWQYMFICTYDKDEELHEELIAKAQKSFIDTLNRIPSEPNEYMKLGIEYEEECYKGNTECSPIIAGGSYQIVGKKEITVSGMNFLMYGRLDVLKEGIIYDIKRVQKWNLGKYRYSHQHAFYLELFPQAYKFEYLIWDGNALHKEDYMKEDVENIGSVIANFIKYLETNNLIEIYKKKWKTKGE